MSQLPCVKAVDETLMCVHFQVINRKKPQTNANPKPDQFRDPHVVVQTLGLA